MSTPGPVTDEGRPGGAGPTGEPSTATRSGSAAGGSRRRVVAGPRRVPGVGVELAVEVTGVGDGPPVVLVHGFPDDHAVWDLVRPLLEDRCCVVTYDVRGAGGSSDPGRDGYRLELLVADLEAVLDATVGATPVHLVGHDWGSIQSWEAVLTPRLAPRFASYTSISGPPLDHVGARVRQDLHRGAAGLRDSGRQLLRSWYVYAFHLPGLPRLVGRAGPAASARMRRVWSAALRRLDGVPTDARWPPPDLASHVSRGMHLYRDNVRARLAHPRPRISGVPVQLIVPTGDRYVAPSTLAGLEGWSVRLWWRELATGHWANRTQPAEVAAAVLDMVDLGETGIEAPRLAASRRCPADGGGGVGEA